MSEEVTTTPTNDVELLFTVIVKTDGSMNIALEPSEEVPTVNRPATTADVYQISQNIVKEIETQLLVERVASVLAAASAPAPEEPKVSKKVKDALKERGIDPESVSTEE